MAKARVSALAKEVGLQSKQLIEWLNNNGEYVKTPSSTIEAPVVAKVLRRVPAGPRGRAEAGQEDRRQEGGRGRAGRRGRPQRPARPSRRSSSRAGVRADRRGLPARARSRQVEPDVDAPAALRRPDRAAAPGRARVRPATTRSRCVRRATTRSRPVTGRPRRRSGPAPARCRRGPAGCVRVPA